MDDFSIPGVNNSYGIPPSPANFIVPRKMPLSSMCPTILLDENRNVELVMGAAGGSKITSSVAYVRRFNCKHVRKEDFNKNKLFHIFQVLLRYLYFNESLVTAVRAPRLHHQLVPMELQYEEGFTDDIIDGLSKIGHKMVASPSDSGFAALTAIGREGKRLVPVFDHRRRGSIEIM